MNNANNTKTTIETIEAAQIPAVVNANIRHESRATRSAAIRKLFAQVGIKGASVTMSRGSGCYQTEIRFAGVECKDEVGHLRSRCEQCKRNTAASDKIEQIILAAFPDLDDRSDSMSDHFDFMFSVHCERPEAEENPAPVTARPAVTSGPARASQPEPEVVYVPTQPERPRELEQRKYFGNAADIWTACRDLETEDREHMVAFFLDIRHRLIGERYTLAIGTVSGVECGPRELYREALKRNAAAVIVAHNHPSGDPSPSRQDVELTKRIRDAGQMLGLRLLDHIVVGACSYTSLDCQGVI